MIPPLSPQSPHRSESTVPQSKTKVLRLHQESTIPKMFLQVAERRNIVPQKRHPPVAIPYSIRKTHLLSRRLPNRELHPTDSAVTIYLATHERFASRLSV